jgi:diaminopropionate ammonia-lyase
MSSTRRHYNCWTISALNTVSAFLPSTALPKAAQGLFSANEYVDMRAFFAARPQLAATPTQSLSGLASTLGLGSLYVKNETARFGLNAFKLLGARFALEALIADGTISKGDLLTCASEGNHGRAVARAARECGCRAKVYMAHDAAQARVDAIAGEGAEVIRVRGSYDDAVRLLQDDARATGATIVSDTSWTRYERIPRLIMLGYTRMAEEIASAGLRPDVVFVQGGVGGLLCGVASWFAMHSPATRIVCVEPTSAACLQASAQAGKPVAVDGELTTAMAGLRNREVSPLAFDAVRSIVSAFVAIDDAWTIEAMRALKVAGISAGASGAAALGGVLAICRDDSMAEVRRSLQLDAKARVVAIVSEGVTDPSHWQSATSPS